MIRKFLFLPLLLCVVVVMAEPKLTIIDMNGYEQQFALSQLGKITFENDVMYLYNEEGTLLGFTDVENVGQIVVEEVQNIPTSIDQLDGKIHVYPNPAQGTLIIKNIPAGQTIRVYDIQGRLMSATLTQDEQTQIIVSGLQNGTYLLQVGAQVVKFIKE